MTFGDNSADRQMGSVMSRVEVSKVMSHALRHEPWLYELELDDEGWVPVDALVGAVRTQAQFGDVDRAAIDDVVRNSAKQRFEIEDGRIRELYGHSVPGRLIKRAAVPPELLFHGTSPDVERLIRTDGLRPMSRQFVHLSTDRAVALEVGRRKSAQPVVLRVHAAKAHAAGVRFPVGNDAVWLADHVPSEFIDRHESGSTP